MKSRFNYRVYPTHNQKVKLAKLFGCTRVVWNDALACCQESYQTQKKHPKGKDLHKIFITQAKKTKEREWLSDCSAIPLQQAINDLNLAYDQFFQSCQGERKGKKLKPPKFKKKKSKQTARFTKNGFKVGKDKVYLAKIGKLKIVWSRILPSVPSSVTIIKDSANRYFLSFVVEVSPSFPKATKEAVGIDLGITTFATLDDGTKIDAPKPLKKNLRKLRKLQKALSRQTDKNSKRRERQRLKIAKLHAKIKDIRTDFLHKLSTKLVIDNQVVVLEDLNVSGMLKNRKLSRAISDLGWYKFRILLESKCAKEGRDFRVISRWEPTSKTCSNCGFKVAKMELSTRKWKCVSCHTEHDRDVNAAKNIRVAGGHSETQKENGHGGNVSPSPQKKAISNEVSTRPEVVQLTLFNLDDFEGIS
jgi:putative transposase